MKDFKDLTDADLDAFQAALAAHVGTEEARRPTWLRRAVLADDGTWLIACREVKEKSLFGFKNSPHAVGRDFSLSPWTFPLGSPEPSDPSYGGLIYPELQPGMAVLVKHLPIAEAVALLRSDQNPEIEVDRRMRLFDEANARAAQRAIDQKTGEVEQRKAGALHRARRPERWLALPREIRVLYAAAAAIPRTPAEALLLIASLAQGADLDRPPATFEMENI